MAKQGTEEKVPDIDTEFELDESNVDDAQKTETDKVSQTTESKEATTEKAPEAPEKEQVSEEADTAAKTEKTWKDLGVGDFEGKGNEEIAKIVLQRQEESEFRNRVYGDQSNELGELRKFKAEQEAKAAAPEKKEEPDLLEQMGDMSEGEVVDFNKIYEKNPVKAMLKYGGPVIKQMITKEIQSQRENVEGFVGESIEAQRDGIAFSNFLSKHDDADQHLPLMKTLDTKKYLGEQSRTYEELFELAKLGNSKDPLYKPTFQLMAKHPTLSFKDAKIFAKQKAGSEEQAAEKEKKLQDEVDKIDSVNSSSTTTKKSDTTTKLVTVDEEFDI